MALTSGDGTTQTPFLRDFVEQKMYLQNPPLSTDQFITFCKKLGIHTTPEELEAFEKDRLLFPFIRLQRPIQQAERIHFTREDGSPAWGDTDYRLQQGERETGRDTVRFYAPYDVFQEDREGLYYHTTLLRLLKDGNLFDPSTRPFAPWESFMAEELAYDNRRVISFYSSFQVYWLDKLKRAFTMTVTFLDNKLEVVSSLALPGKGRETASFRITDIDKLSGRFHQIAAKSGFERCFDIGSKKDALRQSYGECTAMLRFLLSVQCVYFPYVASSGKHIRINGDYAKWKQKRRGFALTAVLEKQALTLEQITQWYKLFSDEAQRRLGVARDDWIQLWKQIGWEKKDALEGQVRLGVEYLQWAVMFKRVLEDHLQREILDIDEMEGIAPEDVLAFVPETMDDSRVSLRAMRNTRYADTENSYYHDHYKRLFYLANDFELDYQPRVMVFVEGDTEKTVFPEIFEWLTGQTPKDLGVEFVSIQGISRFFGKQVAIKTASGKYQKGFISNFNRLASYNLNQWQIIPFFVGDNENDIVHLLRTCIALTFNDINVSFPTEWQYIWGVANHHKPFHGKDFEMANFSDNEIASVLSAVVEKQINPSDVKWVRCDGHGIKQLGADVEARKIQIGKELMKTLMESCDAMEKEKLSRRPIYKVMDIIVRLAVRNHPPIDR